MGNDKPARNYVNFTVGQIHVEFGQNYYSYTF